MLSGGWFTEKKEKKSDHTYLGPINQTILRLRNAIHRRICGFTGGWNLFRNKWYQYTSINIKNNSQLSIIKCKNLVGTVLFKIAETKSNYLFLRKIH